MNEKQKRIVALYETSYGSEVVNDVAISTFGDWIQISEPLEIELTPLPKETVLNEKVKAIDALIEKEKTEAMEKINQLTQKRQELLALTN
jgi:hypothetical protein